LLQLESLLLLLAGDGCHGETEMQAGKGSAEKIREEKKTARSGQGRAGQGSQGVQRVCKGFYAPRQRDHRDIIVVMLL
jgi:hypothetical protein